MGKDLQTVDSYIPRLIDRELARKLQTFGAVEIAGTMGCGKTWTSTAQGKSMTRLEDKPIRMVAEADPQTALMGDLPHVIDEWQTIPALWDTVRIAVDQSGTLPGQFILTASSQPRKELILHSGAGRISSIRMRTMSLLEKGLSSGKVSLGGLFRGEFTPQLVQQKLWPLAQYICQGGWPALANHPEADVALYLDSYFDALFDVILPNLGLRSLEARNAALSLAKHQGSPVTLSTIAANAQFGEGPSKGASEKASKYISALQEMYIVEAIKGWDAPVRSKSRVRTKPKYYFADPSMGARLLDVTPDKLVQDGQLFSVLFEAMCMHDLLVYTALLPEAGPDAVHYYRDSDGLETDAVIELRDGRWAAMEIELGENKMKESIRSLSRLRNKIAANPAARNPEPSFLAVLVGAGEYARYDPTTGVYIIPLTALGV